VDPRARFTTVAATIDHLDAVSDRMVDAVVDDHTLSSSTLEVRDARTRYLGLGESRSSHRSR